MTVSTNSTVRKINWLWVKLIPTLRRSSPTAFATSSRKVKVSHTDQVMMNRLICLGGINFYRLVQPLTVDTEISVKRKNNIENKEFNKSLVFKNRLLRSVKTRVCELGHRG